MSDYTYIIDSKGIEREVLQLLLDHNYSDKDDGDQIDKLMKEYKGIWRYIYFYPRDKTISGYFSSRDWEENGTPLRNLDELKSILETGRKPKVYVHGM